MEGTAKMEKQFIGEAQIEGVQVRYYLLEELGEEGRSYGVQVELENETATAQDLSSSRQRVETLTERLVRGSVTPVGLRDVVDDWLLE